MNSNDNQNNQETEQPKRRRYSGIFDDVSDNGGDDVSLESALAASAMKPHENDAQYETVIIDGDEYDFEITPETSEAQTFTVSQDDNEIVIDSETFIVTVNSDGSVSVEIDGGYGLADYDDGSQDYIEIDGRYEVARFDDIEIGDSYDSDFKLTITPEMIADAKAYRANYPIAVESEF